MSSAIVISLLNLRYRHGHKYDMGPLGKLSTSGKVAGSLVEYIA